MSMKDKAGTIVVASFMDAWIEMGVLGDWKVRNFVAFFMDARIEIKHGLTV